MKNTLILSIRIILLSSICLLACKNETPSADIDKPGTESLRTSALENPASTASGKLTFTYDACGILVNTYDPPVRKYTLAMSYGSSFRKFGIPSYGLLNFTNIDVVTFEFSGKYTGKANNVKLYQIRRSDGKYLTLQFDLTYAAKLPSGQDSQQLWILNDLGNNKFNIILPNYSSYCWIVQTYQQGANYRIQGLPNNGNTNFPGNKTIYIHPVSAGS